MPTEHEFKYVMNLDFAKEHTEDQLRVICPKHRRIDQGVLLQGNGSYLRVRRTEENSNIAWHMTFKLKDADRTIEIETPLIERDAFDLWGRCSWKLRKDRYIHAENGIDWEIDLFKTNDRIYFILAEAELPEGSLRPKKIPCFLKKHLIYEVPLTDDRCSNKRLGNVSYADKLYEHLIHEGTPNVRKIKKGKKEKSKR